jgi:hypothetical protein
MTKLSATQFNFLGRYVERGRMGVEKDGTYMPYVNESRTARALEDKDLVKWVNCGESIYIYNGYVITDEGKAAHKAQSELT